MTIRVNYKKPEEVKLGEVYGEEFHLREGVSLRKAVKELKRKYPKAEIKIYDS